MKKVKFSVGIDISAEFFTITILSFTLQMVAQAEFFMNDEGYQQFHLWLKKNKVTRQNCYLIMESTGVYPEHLCLFLHNNGYSFSVACPLKVKRAFGIKINMNDWIASKHIAEYGIRFSDQLIQWQPPDKIFEQVKLLLSFREQLVRNNTAYKNRVHAIKRKIVQSESIIEDTKIQIEITQSTIKKVEKEIIALLKSEQNIGSLYLRIKSVPGVGMLLAAELLVLTNGFTKTVNHKEIAGYLGICPAKKQSGKNIHRKAKSTGRGPGRIRKLVYLAAGTLSSNNKSFREYSQRKQLAGKVPMLILNNIANKMIKIICGVAKSGKPFIKNYQSLPPALAA
jgi:transposase